LDNYIFEDTGLLVFRDGLVISDVSEWTSTFLCKDQAFILIVPHLTLKIKAPRHSKTSGPLTQQQVTYRKSVVLLKCIAVETSLRRSTQEVL